jgi:DmsE family decaheme c-type cytochrome
VVLFGRDAPTAVSIQNGMCSGCHETDLGAGWHGGAHAENDVACAACHRSHVARDPILTPTAQIDTCGSCHTVIRLEQHRAFTHPLDESKMTCTSCHDAHGAPSDAALLRPNTNETCYTCHADKRGPFLWEHAPVAEDCALCHAPHGSNHPGMLVQRAPMLCQNCHSEAGHPSIAPTPGESLPGGARSQYVLGMNCMNCHPRVHGSNHPSGSMLMR